MARASAAQRMKRVRDRDRLEAAFLAAVNLASRIEQEFLPELAADLAASRMSAKDLRELAEIVGCRRPRERRPSRAASPRQMTPGEGEVKPALRSPPSVAQMRQVALDSVITATGAKVERLDARQQTYRTGGGKTFYLRTRAPDRREGGLSVFWFGFREQCWQDRQAFFVMVCGTDFSLVVPVQDWLPYHDAICISMSGLPEQARQPHIYATEGAYELREGDLVLDVRPWINRYDLLAP